MKLDEVNESLFINQHKLDEDIVLHPELLFNVSVSAARATANRDILKDKISTVDSSIDLDVRETAARNGEKITEGKIKSMVSSSEAHKEAYEAWVNASRVAAEWAAAKDAVSTRGFLIRDLVQLTVHDMAANSSVSVEGSNGAESIRTAVVKKCIDQKRKKIKKSNKQ